MSDDYDIKHDVQQLLNMCADKPVDVPLAFCEIILDALKDKDPEEYIEFMLFLNNQFLNSGLVERPDGVHLH